MLAALKSRLMLTPTVNNIQQSRFIFFHFNFLLTITVNFIIGPSFILLKIHPSNSSSLTSEIKRSMTRRASDRGIDVVKRVRNHDDAYMEVSKFCVWKCTCRVGNSSCEIKNQDEGKNHAHQIGTDYVKK